MIPGRRLEQKVNLTKGFMDAAIENGIMARCNSKKVGSTRKTTRKTTMKATKRRGSAFITGKLSLRLNPPLSPPYSSHVSDVFEMTS